MLNFICQLDWAKGRPDIDNTLFLLYLRWCFLKRLACGSVDCRLRGEDQPSWPPRCGLAASCLLKAPREQRQRQGELILRLILSGDIPLLPSDFTAPGRLMQAAYGGTEQRPCASEPLPLIHLLSYSPSVLFLWKTLRVTWANRPSYQISFS